MTLCVAGVALDHVRFAALACSVPALRVQMPLEISVGTLVCTSRVSQAAVSGRSLQGRELGCDPHDSRKSCRCVCTLLDGE